LHGREFLDVLLSLAAVEEEAEDEECNDEDDRNGDPGFGTGG